MADVDERRRSTKRCISIDTDSNQNEVLDPRIFAELEKLNTASDAINSLESDTDKLRAEMQAESSERMQQLSALADKLGSCVEKARPYYDARIQLREIQLKAQDVAQRYEKACGDLSMAKEMVRVAEDCYSRLGRPDDSAWQEMLNHSTMKVNEAELERKRSELEHERMTQMFSEAQRKVALLQKEQKRSIAKSKPYFETKAKVNLEMEERKKKLQEKDHAIAQAKAIYTMALRALEQISDEIHQQRELNTHKRISRTNLPAVVSDETEEKLQDIANANFPPSNHNADSDALAQLRDTIKRASAGAKLSAEFESRSQNDASNLPSLGSGAVCAELVSCFQNSFPSVSSDDKNRGTAISSPAVKLPAPGPSPLTGAVSKTDDIMDGSRISSVIKPLEKPRILVRADTETLSATENSNNTGKPSLDTCNANAEVMQSIMRQKANADARSLSVLKSGSDHPGDDASDKESVTSSFVSANLLTDEQIESLMLDPSDYQKILEGMNEAEVGRFKILELPAKLSYLQKYMNFDAVWIEDNFDNCKKSGALVSVSSCPVSSAENIALK